MNISNLLATIDSHWMLEGTFYCAVEQTMDRERWQAWCMRDSYPMYALTATKPGGQVLNELERLLAGGVVVSNTPPVQISPPRTSYGYSADGNSDLPYRLDNGIATIDVNGPLTKRATWLSYYYGGTSTMDVVLALAAAIQDPNVQLIVLKIDSPGGQVSGTFELADYITNAKFIKPVVAYVSDLCASAAYALASQCTMVVANRTAMVGSIGTYMVVRDLSAMYGEAGIKTYVVNAGDFKGAGTPGTEITPAQRAEFKRTVEALNDQFLSTVASGRRLSEESLAALADGRVHVGQSAVELGLVDHIATFDDCMSQLYQLSQARAW